MTESLGNKKQEWFDDIYQETRWTMRMTAQLYMSTYPDMGNSVEDVVQETYMRMYEKYEDLCEHENITGWLIEALKRNIRNIARKRGRERERILYSMDEPERVEKANEGTENPTEDEVLRREMIQYYREEVIRQIGIEAYETMRAHYVNGKSLEELARESGTTTAAMKMRFLRWRQRCQLIYMLIFIFHVTLHLE